jgi:hypothetical protein
MTKSATAHNHSFICCVRRVRRDALLYHDDWLSVVRRFPFNFRYDVALSREQLNRAGGKLYIQVRCPHTSSTPLNRSRSVS